MTWTPEERRRCGLPPLTRTIDVPEGGWKELAFYLVLVSYRPSNPIHKAIFYTGFLNDPEGGPGGYNQVWNPTNDAPHWFRSIDQVHFLKVVRFLYDDKEMEVLEFDAERINVCPSCQGTGYVDHITCNGCGGSGRTAPEQKFDRKPKPRAR